MKNLLLILSLHIITLGYAQDFKFGKVSAEELQEQYYPLDSSAHAAMLYRDYNVRFDYIENQGFHQIVQVHERIKIYDKEGFDWATKKIQLYNGSNSKREDLAGLKGYTYNLVDGKIVEHKLQKDALFKEEVNEYWNKESFTMPNIKEGCVIEYKYQIQSPFYSIDDIDLQYTIPIKKLNMQVATPQYFEYSRRTNPRAAFYPDIKDSRRNKVMPFQYYENVINSELTDVPALKPEPMVDNLNNYRAYVMMELSMVKIPNQPTEPITSSWEKVTKTIYESSSFGGQISKSGYYEDDLTAAIDGATKQSEKVFRIYNLVKSKVKWNGFNSINVNQGVRSAYKEGTGNTAEINLMLLSMLRSAGIKAYPVLVSTKSNGIPLFPTIKGFNYVVVLAEGADFKVLLDATDPYGSINTLPLRAINWQGRMISENGDSDWVSLQPQKESVDFKYLHAEIDENWVVHGSVRRQMTEYTALQHRNECAELTEDEYVKRIEKDKGELFVKDLKLENLKNPYEPVSVTYNYDAEDMMEEIGDKIYFSPLLGFAKNENPFVEDSRFFPIDLVYPIKEKYVINIKIPDGYEVESLPKNEKHVLDESSAIFTYIAGLNGNLIQLSLDLDINKTFILPNEYSHLKNFFGLMTKKSEEQIVLKKI